MREGWANRIIGDCFTGIKNGANIQQKKGAAGIPITRIETLSGSVFNRDRLGYADITALGKYSSFVLNDGDILMSHINSLAYIGRAVQYHKDGEETIIHGMNLLRLIPIRNIILPSFAEYYFKTDAFKWDIQGIANVSIHQASFNTKALKALSIPVPSIQEQQRIVDILDREFAKIDALKANAEKSLQAAKDLFQATLKKELEPKEGWRTEPFGEVCQYYKEQGLFPSLRYVGMENIEAESGTLLGTMSGEQVQSSSFHFYPGDVLYGRLRPYLKKVVVADFEGCCSTEIFPVRSKECIPGFLQYWFLDDDTTNRINATCSGCRMPRANMKDVLSFEISFPDKKEQEEVVQRIKTLCDNAKALQENYQKTLSLCDDLKQALLRKAFNGEL